MSNWKKTKTRLLSALAVSYVKVLDRTSRVRLDGIEKIEALDTGVILCGWHGKALAPSFALKQRGAYALISHSRDGELENRLFASMGFKSIRGSTGRGGARAAIEAIRILREKSWLLVSPDGPRGPAGVVQSGAVIMAKKSGAALIPVGVSARPAYRAKSWDRHVVPYPFASVLMVFGEPIYIDPSADDSHLEEARLRLEQAIHEMDQKAERDV